MKEQHQHAIKIVFKSDREITNDEIEALLGRIELEVAEPQVFDDSDPTNLMPILDADYSTSDIQIAYENLTLVAPADRVIGSHSQLPEVK